MQMIGVTDLCSIPATKGVGTTLPKGFAIYKPHKEMALWYVMTVADWGRSMTHGTPMLLMTSKSEYIEMGINP